VAEREGKVVGVKKGKKIGTSFHPELTPSCTWHQAFLEACVSDEL
jgi:glutamine amidotransferase PdxT